MPSDFIPQSESRFSTTSQLSIKAERIPAAANGLTSLSESRVERLMEIVLSWSRQSDPLPLSERVSDNGANSG